MSISLCETFRSLAFSTHAQLAKSRRVGHQPLEETFTDLNILELKDRHPFEIYSKTFSKRREGVSGADWEWWLTNNLRSAWLGLRVQAKVLHLATNSFPHLHYQSGTPKTYQLDKLKSEAARNGLFPLYCLYTHGTSHRGTSALSCRTFSYAPESYGCALTSISHVASLQATGKAHDLASVMSAAVLWHCLVCCTGYATGDLPTTAWSYLQATFGASETLNGGHARLGPRESPPPHVLDALEGREADDLPNGVQGVLVIAARDNG